MTSVSVLSFSILFPFSFLSACWVAWLWWKQRLVFRDAVVPFHAAALFFLLLLPLPFPSCTVHLHLIALAFPLTLFLLAIRTVRYTWRRYQEIGRVLRRHTSSPSSSSTVPFFTPSIPPAHNHDEMIASAATNIPLRRPVPVFHRRPISSSTFHPTQTIHEEAYPDSPTQGPDERTMPSPPPILNIPDAGYSASSFTAPDSNAKPEANRTAQHPQRRTFSLIRAFPTPPPSLNNTHHAVTAHHPFLTVPNQTATDKNGAETHSRTQRRSFRLSVTTFRQFIDATFRVHDPVINTDEWNEKLSPNRDTSTRHDETVYSVEIPGPSHRLVDAALLYHRYFFTETRYAVIFLLLLLVGMQCVAIWIQSQAVPLAPFAMSHTINAFSPGACDLGHNMVPFLIATYLPIIVLSIPLAYMLIAAPGRDAFLISRALFLQILLGLIGFVGTLSISASGAVGSEIWLTITVVLWQLTDVACITLSLRRCFDTTAIATKNYRSTDETIEWARDEAFQSKLTSPDMLCDLVLCAVSYFSVSRLFLLLDLERVYQVAKRVVHSVKPMNNTHHPWQQQRQQRQQRTSLDELQSILAHIHALYLAPNAVYAISQHDLSIDMHLKLNRLALCDADGEVNRDVKWWLRVRAGGDVVVLEIMREAICELRRTMRYEWQQQQQ